MSLLQISVIEDSAIDILLLRHAVEKIGLNCVLTLAADGEQAVDCLLTRNKFEGCSCADLVLLDMHLPKLDGLEILRRVPNSERMPICVLTGSDAERALVRAHFGGAMNYFVKPITPEMLLDILICYPQLRPELAA